MERPGPRLAAPWGDLLDLAAIVVSASLLGLVAEQAEGLPRVLLALAFTLFVPGRAIVTNWPRIARWSQLGMSVVFSLALLTLVATTALWARAWHPVGLFEVAAALSLIALAAGLTRRYRLRQGVRADTAGPQQERAS